MKGKFLVTGWSALLSLSLLLSACGTQETVKEPVKSVQTPSSNVQASKGPETAKNNDPLGKYEKPVTISVVREVNNTYKFAKGEDIENNIWTKAYEDKLGIKLKYLWTAPDRTQYEQKMNISIASGELPDIGIYNPTVYGRLVREGKLADISDAYKNMATDRFKKLMNVGDGITLKSTSVNGKLFGIGIAPSLIEWAEVLYIRSDWMNKLNLSAPKTMDDVINIARAFAKNDPDGNGKPDTYGLGVNKELYGGTSSLVGFFNAYHAYPNKIWLEKDGKLIYGAIQPEIKAPLKKLAEMYREGLIDKEFGVKGQWAEIPQDQIAGKIGMGFGPHWLPVYPFTDLKKKDPKAEWTVCAIPSADEKPALSQINTQVNEIYGVSATCKNPEALIKLSNLSAELLFGNPENNDFHDKDGIETHKYAYPRLYDPNFNVECMEKVTAAIKSGDGSKLNPEQKGYNEKVKGYNDNKKVEDWAFWMIYKEGGVMSKFKEVFEKKQNLFNKAYGPDTATWTEKGQNLYNKQVEYFTKAIITGNVDAEFDNWTKYFNDQGGSKIVEEMNAWWATQK